VLSLSLLDEIASILTRVHAASYNAIQSVAMGCSLFESDHSEGVLSCQDCHSGYSVSFHIGRLPTVTYPRNYRSTHTHTRTAHFPTYVQRMYVSVLTHHARVILRVATRSAGRRQGRATRRSTAKKTSAQCTVIINHHPLPTQYDLV
jgi:hypothetical protein